MTDGYDFTVEAIEERIKEVNDRALEVVKTKLTAGNALIKEVKTAMSKGIDMITTTQLMEWAVAIPVIIEDFVPDKEAFSLTKDLWDIEIRQMGAKNLLELDMKKTEIDAINKMSGTEHAKRRRIAEYVQNVLNGVQESLWMLSHAIRKILDSRIASGSYE